MASRAAGNTFSSYDAKYPDFGAAEGLEICYFLKATFRLVFSVQKFNFSHDFNGLKFFPNSNTKFSTFYAPKNHQFLKTDNLILIIEK